ncbi:MAG TPA: hypothetical protein VF039_12450 [Longimicrobiales bacterium]
MRSSAASLIAACILLTGCAEGDGTGDAETELGSAPEAPAASGGQPATTIHLVVGGGPHAGTYDVTSADVTCSYGYAGPGSWGNQYSVTDKGPDEFSSLQLIVPDTRDAADGTGTFLLTVGFGSLMDPGYTEHTIDTGATLGGGTSDREHQGSGTITVDDRGQTGKVTFSGTTGDDITLEGTIDCHRLMRSGE